MAAILFAFPVGVDEPPGGAMAMGSLDGARSVGGLAAGGGGAIAAFIRATRACC
jgi:hypothetical protein